MSRRVLVLGAGMVAPPVVEYLLERTDFTLKIADQLEEKARRLTDGRPRAEALTLDFGETRRIDEEITGADLVISILPYIFHAQAAEMCIRRKVPLITASYVSDEIRRLDAEARAAGVLILNEVGLDPGIDHMEAMRLIHDIQGRGGEIRGFTSFCGGLPAPEANDNPLGYKFSWSPLGVLMAGKNPARYLEGGSEVRIPSEELFERPRKIELEGVGVLEGYPNRDSIPYIELYGIPETRTMLRGTLRYSGWCPFLHAAGRLGYLDDVPAELAGLTYAGFLRQRLKAASDSDLREALLRKLAAAPDAPEMAGFEWLGLMEEEPLPREAATPLDVMAARMQERLQYAPGERDMIVLQHRFEAVYPGGESEEIVSSLIDFGIPDGDSSMARTVGYPLAICARLVLEGRIQARGVVIPVSEEFYRPVLDELRTLDIAFHEIRRRLS